MRFTRKGQSGDAGQAATDGEIIVGLDLGTQAIKALVAQCEPDGSLTYLAGGEFPSDGIREGMVTHLERAQVAIDAALDDLERASGERILSAAVSVNGPRVRSQITSSKAPVLDPNEGVTMRDVARLVEMARQATPPDEHSGQVHVLPRHYSVDDIGGIQNPVRMFGYDLSLEALIITAPLAVTQNLDRLLSDARVEPLALVASPLAAAESVRGQADIGLPVAVVDLGAQTTGLTLYADGHLAQCDALPLGGDLITREIAMRLRLPFDVAETLKRRYATCLPSQVGDDDLIEMEPLNGEESVLPAKLVAGSAAVGARQLAASLLAQFQRAQRNGRAPAMILLTGGGAELNGLDTLLEAALRIPVQVARPDGLIGAPPPLTRPTFAVATGLLVRGAAKRGAQTRGRRHLEPTHAPFLLGRIFGGAGSQTKAHLNPHAGGHAGGAPTR